MDSVATAGVHPGDTAKVRQLSARIDQLRNLRLLDRIIAGLEGVFAPDAKALRIHREVRDRLRTELGL